MKEDIFFKFKDYNKELEKILEKKDFSKDTKNLLLSMFYKLEISYNDYFTVKRRVKTKQEYLENVLENIKACNSIELIKPSDENFEEFINNGLYEIDFKLKKISVIANELALLSSIFELNDFQIHLTEEYNLIRNSMPYLLNMAYDMENIEVLRDFNAWSWNTLVKEIKDININLVYQNLKMALDINLFDSIEKEDKSIDVIELIKKELLKKYPENVVEKFLNLIFKISILVYIKISQNEAKRLSEEKKIIEEELEEIKDKKKYIERVSEDKKKLTKDLKQIDLILNSKELLIEEYNKRNEKLTEYNKIFSISHLTEKMQKERKRILEKIDLCNKKIEPKTYINNKNKLQQDFDLLKNINFENENDVLKFIKKLQQFFLEEILKIKTDNIETKEEILDFIYELRYYNFLTYTENNVISDIDEFKEQLESLEAKIILKLYNNKFINTISSSETNDIKIVKNIFNVKIINLEDVYIEIKKENKQFILKMYDGKETLEKEIKLQLDFNKKDKIKLNKKIKLFKAER